MTTLIKHTLPAGLVWPLCADGPILMSKLVDLHWFLVFSFSSYLFPVFLPFHVKSHLQLLLTLQPPTDQPRMCRDTDGLSALTIIHLSEGNGSTHFLSLSNSTVGALSSMGNSWNQCQFYVSPNTASSRFHSFLKCSPLKMGAAYHQ